MYLFNFTMASSSIESDSETNTGARYRLNHSLCFDNIRSKFAEREVILTEKFYCQYDLVPTDFRFNIRFGGTYVEPDETYVAPETSLKVFVEPVSRDATVTSIRIELFDDRHTLLASRENDEPVVFEKPDGYGVFDLFDEASLATSDSETTWRLEIDFVYIALPEQSAVTTVDEPKLRLQQEYGQLLESGKESDFTFEWKRG